MKYLLVLMAFTCAAQTYFVSPSGSDETGNGSSGNRFATPGHAALLARTNSIKSIKLASGNYFNTLISLTNAADSGLTIEAEAGAVPVLYGGQIITGWVTNGLNQEATLPTFPSYTNSIEEFSYNAGGATTAVYLTNRVVTNWFVRDLTIDNIRVRQARLPAYGNWLYYVPSNNSYSVMQYTGTDIPSSTVVENAELQVRYTWQACTVGVTNINTAAKTIMVNPPVTRMFGSLNWSNYALFNTSEGLTNGVWYHDRVNNKLIIKTNSLAGKTVIAPTRSSVVYLIGVTNVTIRGLEVRSTTHPFVVDGIGGRDLAGAIDGWDCYNVKIENCKLENICANGIRLGVTAFGATTALLLNSTISSNIVNNSGASGICFINGTANNNSLTNCGEIFLAAAGIEQNGATSYIISNTVNTTFWSGISSSLGMSNVIVFNTIYDPFKEMDDGCAIYVGPSSNIFIGFNKMYIVAGRQEPSASDGAMSFDGNANYGVMVSNLVVNFHYPITFNGTKGSFASNNICVTTGTITCAIAAFASNGVVTHNIFDSTGPYLKRDTEGITSFANNYFYSPLGPVAIPRNGIFTTRMIDDQYRLVRSSQLISPRINPLTGVVPVTAVNASSVRVGNIRQR